MRGAGGPNLEFAGGSQSAVTLDNSSMLGNQYGTTPKGISGSMGGLMN